VLEDECIANEWLLEEFLLRSFPLNNGKNRLAFAE